MLNGRRSRLVGWRLLQTVPVLLLVTFVSFLLLHLSPVDPAVLLAGENPTDAQIELIRRLYGFDKPMMVQYGTWLWHVLHGNLSVSSLSREPVVTTIANKLPMTLLIVLYSMAISLAVGVPLGIWAASRPRSVIDRVASAVALLGVAVPYFWLAMVLVLIFSLRLNWLPATGAVPFGTDPLGAIRSATLPAVALSLSGIAEILRQVRAALLDVLASNHVRTLRAKGLSPSVILWRHGLKNIGVTLVTVVGLVFNRKLGATVVIETVFAVPGIGSAVVFATINKDFAVVQGIILVLALLVVAVNLAIDLIYTLLDPRLAS